MIKQEKMPKYCGKYWNEIKDVVCEDRWYRLLYTILNDLNINKLFKENNFLWDTKFNHIVESQSLKVIESSNGRIKLESNDNPLKTPNFYWVLDNDITIKLYKNEL